MHDLFVFASLTCFSWLSYSRFDLVAMLARSLVLDFEQLLSFFFENDISLYFFGLIIEPDSFEKISDFPFLVGLQALLGLALLNC